MEKVKNAGKVAVLYSPGFGAGWSTWAKEKYKEALCMDARIVQPFLDGNKEDALEAALELFPGVYTGGFRQCTIKWIDEGSEFEIQEYDGSESIHIIGERKYLVA